MIINNLKINSFGKIKNKEIKLDNGINVFYGNNEAGKSTILNFIISTFYGISKNKKGKVFSNYDKYKPWVGEEFSGKIQYELDNNKKYEIFRDFNKKNPKIFDENSEDISKQFNIDKKTGNEFFYEQTKVDEDLFLSTIGIMQKEVKLEENNQNFLVQKLANLVGTGDDNVSFKKAIERINKRQLDEIGTDRSREKPINIVNKKIEELELEKNSLENFKDDKYEIAEEENNLLKNIEKLENKNNCFKEIKLLLENNKIEKEKINIKENILKDNLEKINNLENKLIYEKNSQKELEEKNNLKINKNKKIKNKLNKKLILFFTILIIINLLIILSMDNNLKYIFLLTIPGYLLFSYLLKNKINKKMNMEINKEKNNLEENFEIKNIENEINLLKRNNKNLIDEIEQLNKNFNLKNNLEIEKIKNKYNISFIENDLEQINLEKENIQNELNFNKIELHKLKLDKENIEPKLDELAKIEEELIFNKNIKNNLEKLNNSILIAKDVLEESYTEMKENITPKFTNNLSKIISLITNNKYNKIKFNEENGIIVELDNGDYVEIDKLSTGTIEQLYLSLRISMIDELSEEKLPLFLDETFAYYDDERLQNILLFLLKEAKRRQIFIFTCSKREIDILNGLNADYNMVEIL